MSTIFIRSDLGITYENMPEEIFGYMQGNIDVADDGGPKFCIAPESEEIVIDKIIRAVMANTQERARTTRFGSTILIKRSEEANADVPAPPVQEEDFQEENEDNFEAPDGPYAPDDQDVDNANTVPAPDEPETMVSPANAAEESMLNNDDDIKEMMAGAMESEISSIARNRSSKRDSFERQWTRLLILKREIDEAGMFIDENPIISKLIGQANEIKNADNLIEDIFFSDDAAIILKTKELVTDIEIDGHKRVVGRMEIKIDLRPVIGSSTECENPVKVRNLDRRYFDGEQYWECGHSPSFGGICWGTGWELLFNSMSLRDLPSIIEVVLRFIKNPNERDSWGNHMRSWPIYEGGS